MTNKNTGSYYTPIVLADFLVKHLLKYYSHSFLSKIIEPSCGDGIFVSSINKNLPKEMKPEIKLFDINNNELLKSYIIAKSSDKFSEVNYYHQDYLNSDINDKYSLIIGNPPYISKKNLKKSQINKCKKIINNKLPDSGEVKNIWPAFVIKSTEELEEKGVLCFVLPSELLQVKYTDSIRRYLLSSFDRIEIFAFNELIFDKIEQDVIVFIGRKKVNTQTNRVSFYQVDKLNDLKIPDFIEKNSNINRKKLGKWTNYILSENELKFIEQISLKNSLLPITDFFNKAEVGIVTAANDYFITKRSDTIKNNLIPFKSEIIKRSRDLKGIEINNKEIEGIIEKDLPIDLINIPTNIDLKKFNDVSNFLISGIKAKIHKRYKMQKRNYWYSIPSIWTSSAMFVKRCHLHPKIILNTSQVLCTDSFYRIDIKSNIDLKSFIFSFYNSLTFAQAELEGRFYGGGVLELTPSEFRSLYIPYKVISQSDFDKLNQYFLNGTNINEILNFTDNILFPEITENELFRIRSIWNRLVLRRTKNKYTNELETFNNDKLALTN